MGHISTVSDTIVPLLYRRLLGIKFLDNRQFVD